MCLSRSHCIGQSKPVGKLMSNVHVHRCGQHNCLKIECKRVDYSQINEMLLNSYLVHVTTCTLST